jgi:hypothetical protein
VGTWRDKWQPIWLCWQDLVDATSTDVALACFDDTGDGQPEPRGVASVIARAEGKVLSYLVGEYGPPPLSAQVIEDLSNDPLLGSCALQFAVAFMFDKHPEYVRANKQDDVQKRIAGAEAEMVRILEARQRPPTVPEVPANVGGTSVDNAPRLYTDNPGATTPGQNAGDY